MSGRFAPATDPDYKEQACKTRTMGQPRDIGLYFEFFTNKLAATQALGHPSLPTERRGGQ